MGKSIDSLVFYGNWDCSPVGFSAPMILDDPKSGLQWVGSIHHNFSEWAQVFGDAKMTTALLDRLALSRSRKELQLPWLPVSKTGGKGGGDFQS